MAKKTPHPTLFALQGSIHVFEEGSMLELHTQITAEEWAEIVDDTINYKIFLECLKEVAIPLLEESWTAEEEWFKIQLDVAVSRMRNLDPLLVAKYDQKQIKEKMSDKMTRNGKTLMACIQKMRQNNKMMTDTYNVSGL